MDDREDTGSQEVFREDYDIAGCTEYVCTRGFKQIALQFPDNMLSVAPAVALALQKELAHRGHESQVGCYPLNTI